MAVQSCHALAEFANQHPSVFFYWQINQKNIVLLEVEDEVSLMELFNKIQGKKSKFHEPDINDELTAICFLPTEEDCKLTSKLPLALKEYGRDLVLKGV